jgi:hypothetical protein
MLSTSFPGFAGDDESFIGGTLSEFVYAGKKMASMGGKSGTDIALMRKCAVSNEMSWRGVDIRDVFEENGGLE